MDYEDDYEEYPFSPLSPAVIGVHLWKNPTQTGAFDIVVNHVSNELYFYNSQGTPISASPVFVDGFGAGQPITLPAEYVGGEVLVTASLRGQLLVTFGAEEVMVLSYDELTDTVSSEFVRLKVRDVWGIDDGLEVDERPSISVPFVTSSDALANHIYNLRNQGWPPQVTKTLTADNDTTNIGDSIILPLHEPADPPDWRLPSNADIILHGRADNASAPAAVGAYSPFTLRKNYFGNTPAPKGKFIIDLFDRSTDRQAYYEDNLGEAPAGHTLTEDISSGAVTQVAAYAGRFFYAVNSTGLEGGDERTPNLNTMILFSQVVDSDTDIGACYTDADPTSEFIFDAIATDGGFINIPDAGKVLKLAALGESLFVICSNGVWEVHGGEQAFSATNVNLAKTTAIGAVSGRAVVVSESVLTYWADGGIYLIGIDQTSLRGVATNITISTIQTLYKAIPLAEKERAVGVFDEVDRKIRWLYNRITSSWPYSYGYELVFDVDLQAFYINRFVVRSDREPPPYPFYGVVGIFTIPEVRYVLLKTTSAVARTYSFGYFKNTSFEDFGEHDAEAVLLTGYLTGGTGSSDKRVISLVTHLKRTETGFQDVGLGVIDFENPSGCTITPQWEWTNSTAAGKWGAPFQAYRLQRPYYPSGVEDPFDYGYTVITSKSGIRGRGRALSLLFETQERKDCHILGWGLELEVDEKF